MKKLILFNVCPLLLILFFSVTINSCKKLDVPLNNEEKIEAFEVENIKKSLKASLSNSNSKNLNAYLKNRPILGYGSPFDSTYIGIIVPIYYKDKDVVKGLLNLKLNKNNEIIEETIYGKDEKLPLEHLDRFQLSIDLLKKNGIHFQEDLLEQLVAKKAYAKKSTSNKILDTDKSPQIENVTKAAGQDRVSMTVSFSIELYWVKTCPSSSEMMQMPNLQYELSQEIRNYVGRQSGPLAGNIDVFEFSSFSNVRIKITFDHNTARSPFGEFASEYGASLLLNEWVRRGPISNYDCLGNRNLTVFIRNYVQTTNSFPQPGTPGNDLGVSLPTFLNFVAQQPFILIPKIPCPIIQNWISTAKYVPNGDVINKLSQVAATPHIVPGLNSPIIARIQSINNAYSSTVNMDYFSVKVNQLPIIGNERITPADFLQYLRVNINRFVDQNLSVFTPYSYYGVHDEDLWNSPDPTGAIIGIDIPGPNNGSVIVSQSNPTGWTFTTINDPRYQDHPVSGNRDFGYEQNSDGSYTFFTRGVDRITNWDISLIQAVTQFPFNQADALWMSFQSKIATFINLNQGNAVVNAPVKHRPDWALVKQVINGQKPISQLSTDCN